MWLLLHTKSGLWFKIWMNCKEDKRRGRVGGLWVRKPCPMGHVAQCNDKRNILGRNELVCATPD